jgi:hypothetical protein
VGGNPIQALLLATGLPVPATYFPMLCQKRIISLSVFLGMLLTQVGCVALNIPSQRFHDPADKGGLFGHWNSNHGHNAHHSTSHEFHDSCGPCLDGGPLEEDPLEQVPAEPEVPWPRFHPVPTRPIFGSSHG